MTPRRLCLSFAPVLLAMLCLVRSGAAAEPRWVPLGPPAAPLAARLVVEGNRAYAFNEAGLWLSRDGAGSWRSIQAGLGRPPQSVALDPSRPGRIYAAVTEIDYAGGIDRSDDFGAHWTAVFRSREAEAWVYSQEIQADPSARDTLLWVLNRRLYRSRDAGRTWDCVPLVDDCLYQSTLTFAFAPGRPNTLYALNTDSGFHVSHDGGRTSTATRLTVLQNLDTLLATREPRTLYAWSRDPYYRGIYTPCFARSGDEGATWKGILPSTKCGAPAFDPNDPRTVRMVVVDNRVPQLWLSRDGGDTWTSQGAVPEFGDLSMMPGGGLALATDAGFFRASSERGPWRAANRGFTASQISAVLPVGKAVLAAPAAPDYYYNRPPAAPLLRTEDGGRSWTGEPLTNPLALAADPSDPSHLIASALRYEGRYYQYARIQESRDGGRTWRGVADPEGFRPEATTLAIDPFEPRTLYAGTLFGLYRSDDGGITWRGSGSGLPRPHCHKYGCSSTPVHTILPDPTRPGRIFIHVLDSAFVSQDWGITWTPLRTHEASAATGVAYALARDSEGALIVISNSARDDGPANLGVAYRSMDSGATWTRLGRLPAIPNSGTTTELTGLAATQGALWVSTRAFGVYRSTDGGATWKPASEGLPLLSVESLVADPEDPARLFVTVRGNGIYTLAAP